MVHHFYQPRSIAAIRGHTLEVGCQVETMFEWPKASSHAHQIPYVINDYEITSSLITYISLCADIDHQLRPAPVKVTTSPAMSPLRKRMSGSVQVEVVIAVRLSAMRRSLLIYCVYLKDLCTVRMC